MTRLSHADRATAAAVVMIAVAAISIYVAGPTELMPYHYGADGQADAWAGREAIGGGIGVLALLTAAFAGGMGVAAARAEDDARARSLRFGQVLILATFLAISLFAGGASVSGLTSLGAVIPMAGLSFLFLLIGALLGRVGPNPIAGVRTPWSYKSRLAWDRSNRLAGRLFFLIGLAGLAVAPVAPQPLGYQLLILAVLFAAVWAAIESWRVWRTDPDRQPF